jgi:hypothetical protein
VTLGLDKLQGVPTKIHFALTHFAAFFLLLAAVPYPAFADAYLLPLDGFQDVDPASFGYTIDVGVLNEHASIDIILTREAAQAFQVVELTWTKGGEDVVPHFSRSC